MQRCEMAHGCPGYCFTKSHPETRQDSRKACSLTLMPEFPGRVPRRKHTFLFSGVVQRTEKGEHLWPGPFLHDDSPTGSPFSCLPGPFGLLLASLQSHVKLNPICAFVAFNCKRRERHGLNGEAAKEERRREEVVKEL